MLGEWRHVGNEARRGPTPEDADEIPRFVDIMHSRSVPLVPSPWFREGKLWEGVSRVLVVISSPGMRQRFF